LSKKELEEAERKHQYEDAERNQRLAEAERKRLEEERRANERNSEEKKRKIQSNRRTAKRCILCGKPLGVFQRLLGRQQHDDCTTFSW
jgi:ribosomal protein S14